VHGSLDLLALFRLLFKNIWVILLACLIGLLGAFGITKLLLKPMYTSTVQLYVSGSQKSSSSSSDYYDVITAQKVVNTYTSLIKSDRVLDEVVLNHNLPYTSNQIRRMMSVSTAQETQIMNISITSDSPKKSMEIVNAIARTAPDIIKDFTETGIIKVIDYAKPITRPSSPNLSLNCIFGIMLGLFVSVLYIVLRDMLDLRVKGEDEIKKLYNIPVLGSIPVLNSQTKGGY
jgi:capsular polysaccharide biosynthesis protein